MPTKRLSALILACGISTVGLLALAQPEKKPAMESTIVDWDSLRATTNTHGLARGVFNSPTAMLGNLECHITTLNPGFASHPPHHHPEEEIVIIRQGAVEALVNGEWKRVNTGGVIFNACNITHDLRNAGDVPAVYHVIMWRSSLTPAMASHTDTIEDSKVTQPKAGVMGPAAIDWNSVPVLTNATGLSREFFKSPTATADLLELHATTINPGASTHPPSRHPQEEIIIVEQGAVEVYMNGDWKHVSPGSVIFNAANAMQAIRNAGQDPAIYFVLEWRTHAG